jgi:flavin reductase (DIM6/NTAB) family NADH-FMN oxidoreductase RutF
MNAAPRDRRTAHSNRRAISAILSGATNTAYGHVDFLMAQTANRPAFDSRLFRDVMGRFATGVTVVSFLRDGAPAGMTVNAFMSVSLAPPLVLVSVRRESSFNDHVRVGSRYGVNILAEDQQGSCNEFAAPSPPDRPIEFSMHEGTPLLGNSLAHVVARVVDIHPAGDHLLYLAEVESLVLGEEAKPLIFFTGRYKQIDAHEPGMQWSAQDGW